MCARGMDAGINGDFEYLINESSKPAFEPSYFSRVSLSLSLCIFYFILILPLYILFFFFRSSANEFHMAWISSFPSEFSGVHSVSFESLFDEILFKRGEFWEGGVVERD